jgi:hypothetical protein
VIVPRGRMHRFANGGDTVARARVEVVPALDMERLLVLMAPLAALARRRGHAERYAADVHAPQPLAA